MDNFLKLKSYAYNAVHGEFYYGDSPDIILEQLGITLTSLEMRIYEWGKANWRTLVDLLDKNITEETIRDYMIENKCEELPIEWVVNILK